MIQGPDRSPLMSSDSAGFRGTSWSALEMVHLFLACACFGLALLIVWKIAVAEAWRLSDMVSGAAVAGFMPVAVSGLAALALVGFGLHLLRRCERLAAQRRLAWIARMVSPTGPEILDVVARISLGPAKPGGSWIAPRETDPRAQAAGIWVLDRFGEGCTIVALPRGADVSALRKALSLSEATVRILRPGEEEPRHE